ncbi:hypothetical protein BCR36DRAFT_416059 [Piromyces finnis]|uniref:Uncharacterized protein n=1 Tax=Piromyces finnis TaxID=1754191 RepID=A0A1Y1UZ10_9FUNG|nr:hypothetical protein BCR36DRAFT_416059 [Piromyces finnis]|eukprot:ORX42574.1 hypothetical protein BCR36DRAFT_416059 [Piromyces finnis]
MKFSTALFTLFAVTSTLAAPLASFEKCKSQILNITSACTAEVGEDREQACVDSLSKKCQAFFVNPLTVEEECQNINENEKESLIQFVKEKHADNNLYCHMESDGQYCPFGDILITTKQLTEQDFKKAITSTCQSKECTRLTIESIQTTLSNTKYQKASSDLYLKWYKEGLAYLKSETCTKA